jgi:hypothetical protein
LSQEPRCREVGGGISQFATTLYNASYFPGMADACHKEHSYYISRYLAARAATVVQNPHGISVIDVKFTNDAPTAVAAQTIWTPSSITVKLCGTKCYTVESVPAPGPAAPARRPCRDPHRTAAPAKEPRASPPATPGPSGMPRPDRRSVGEPARFATNRRLESPVATRAASPGSWRGGRVRSRMGMTALFATGTENAGCARW